MRGSQDLNGGTASHGSVALCPLGARRAFGVKHHYSQSIFGGEGGLLTMTAASMGLGGNFEFKWP